MIDTAIAILLKQHAVGADERVYSGGQKVEAKGAFPRVFYSYIDGTRGYSDDGSDGVVEGRYQLDIFAAMPTDARSIANAIRAGLDGYSGTTAETKIDRIHFPDDARMENAEQAVGQTGAASRYVQDMIVNYRE